MRALKLWPEFDRGLPFGDRYEKVNTIFLQVAESTEADLWTLDALWWRVERMLGLRIQCPRGCTDR